jgi:hypothetical protein
MLYQLTYFNLNTFLMLYFNIIKVEAQILFIQMCTRFEPVVFVAVTQCSTN